MTDEVAKAYLNNAKSILGINLSSFVLDKETYSKEDYIKILYETGRYALPPWEDLYLKRCADLVTLLYMLDEQTLKDLIMKLENESQNQA